MTALNIRIDYLANHPHLTEELARISWNEWRTIYEQRGETFENALKNYQERTNLDCLPLALVAFSGDRLIGTVSLKYYDLDLRPDITLWLGGLFVDPPWRGRGVGSMLMQRAVEEARRLNLPSLFLWTHSAEGLYRKLGWRVVERLDYHGKTIVIMEMSMEPETRSGKLGE